MENLHNLFMMLTRWGHLLFGIGWIGMLYYFNFVQGGYFKAATPEGLKDAKAKLDAQLKAKRREMTGGLPRRPGFKLFERGPLRWR